MLKNISIRGAREHNLKNIDVEIPRDTLTVLTGSDMLQYAYARLQQD